MGREKKEFVVELKDKHARIYISIDGYRPNDYCSFGEIDNSDTLEGAFGFNLYDTDEWGAGEFTIRTESIHRIAGQLREFIHSNQSEVHIDEELRIDIIRKKRDFVLYFSMNDQLTGEYITVEKRQSYLELYRSVLKPLFSISKVYP